MKFEVTTENVEQTEQLARVLAAKMQGGEAIELVGDVGAGKTTFTTGLVAGLESDDHVSSPTFAICNVYTAGRLPIYHFDFYRLGDNDELIKHELAETVEEDNAVVIMEWAQPMRTVLSRDPITIQITTLSESSRKFTVSLPEHYTYMATS